MLASKRELELVWGEIENRKYRQPHDEIPIPMPNPDSKYGTQNKQNANLQISKSAIRNSPVVTRDNNDTVIPGQRGGVVGTHSGVVAHEPGAPIDPQHDRTPCLRRALNRNRNVEVETIFEQNQQRKKKKEQKRKFDEL